jgi:hypothetical protein
MLPEMSVVDLNFDPVNILIGNSACKAKLNKLALAALKVIKAG